MDTIDRILEQKNEQIKQLEEENKTLKDNVEFLHSCLDDRDKSIAIMQEENDKLKIHIEAKDKAYMDLLADYNYLKARIKKTERAFLKYEEKQEKLLGDLDMVVMNR